MKIFDIDFNVLFQINLPFEHRRIKTIAFVRALIEPIVTLYTEFKQFRKDNLYELAHNGQRVKLEAVLNDFYDEGLRRIEIVDDEPISQLFVYLDSENKPVYVYLDSEDEPVYTFLENETTIKYDFIIRVPAFIEYDTNELKALIDKYRLPSKNNYLILEI